jgi:hypothetical protein
MFSKRQSFVRHPSAMLFFRPGGVSQQPEALTLKTSCQRSMSEMGIVRQLSVHPLPKRLEKTIFTW